MHFEWADTETACPTTRASDIIFLTHSVIKIPSSVDTRPKANFSILRSHSMRQTSPAQPDATRRRRRIIFSDRRDSVYDGDSLSRYTYVTRGQLVWENCINPRDQRHMNGHATKRHCCPWKAIHGVNRRENRTSFREMGHNRGKARYAQRKAGSESIPGGKVLAVSEASWTLAIPERGTNLRHLLTALRQFILVLVRPFALWYSCIKVNASNRWPGFRRPNKININK